MTGGISTNANKNHIERHGGDESVQRESELEMSLMKSPRASVDTEKSLEIDMEI